MKTQITSITKAHEAYFDGNKIAKPQFGNAYSYSVWINIDDWEYNYA